MTHPVWTLYARRLGQRLGYWLSALGYNWRDQSTSNRLYLLYFLGFWMVWAVAAFTLVGGWIAAILGLFKAITPAEIALGMAELSLTGWALYSLWGASRRSPFVFSEEDAHLVAQTPVSRPAVALALFLLNWYEAVFPFVAGTVAICFGVVQSHVSSEITPIQIAEFFTYSFQGVSVVVPLHFALQAGAWAVGGLRLRGQTNAPLFAWLAPAVGLVLALTALAPLLFGAPSGVGAWLTRLLEQAWLWPLHAALAAALLPGGAWLLAALAALLAAALGLGAVWAATQRLSFNRAAQETALRAAMQEANRFGRTDLSSALALRQRLGAGHPPSPWLARPGAWVVLAKTLLQAVRAFSFSQLVTWLYIGGLTVGVLTAPNTVVKLLVGGLWILAVSGATTARLRSDMANWWILRQLPVPAQSLFLAEAALPWTVIVLLGVAAVALTPGLALGYRLGVGLALPLLVGSAAFAAGADVMRQARVRTLMVPALTTENVPQPGLWGLIQGLGSVALSLGVLEWTLGLAGAALWTPLALALAFVVAVINLGSMISAFENIY